LGVVDFGEHRPAYGTDGGDAPVQRLAYVLGLGVAKRPIGCAVAGGMVYACSAARTAFGKLSPRCLALRLMAGKGYRGWRKFPPCRRAAVFVSQADIFSRIRHDQRFDSETRPSRRMIASQTANGIGLHALVGVRPALLYQFRPRWRPAIVLGAFLALSGCAAPDPFAAHIQSCIGRGHSAGSASFARCMSTASAGLQPASDEERERRRWHERLLRERLEAERRVRQERALVGLNR